MHDGSDSGEVSLLPPGHDAWVVGGEPVVVIDILGMANLCRAGPGIFQAQNPSKS